MINSFKNEYDFLSNFYPVSIKFEEITYPTVEHAYQAAKSKEFFFRRLIASLPASKAGLAKRRGNDIRLRSDWDKVQLDIMCQLLWYKFTQEPFKTKLLDTGDEIIVEGNYWHDNFWGNCYCKKETCQIEGQNLLGKFLMEIRSQLRKWVV